VQVEKAVEQEAQAVLQEKKLQLKHEGTAQAQVTTSVAADLASGNGSLPSTLGLSGAREFSRSAAPFKPWLSARANATIELLATFSSAVYLVVKRGMMLGAVRHHSMIPGDADADLWYIVSLNEECEAEASVHAQSDDMYCGRNSTYWMDSFVSKANELVPGAKWAFPRLQKG
jgi:hypothetical protein